MLCLDGLSAIFRVYIRSMSKQNRYFRLFLEHDSIASLEDFSDTLVIDRFIFDPSPLVIGTLIAGICI